MSPTLRELELGRRAYRQVELFEENNGQKFFPSFGVLARILGSLAVLIGVLIAFILAPIDAHRLHDFSELAVVVMPIAAVGMVRQYRANQERYAQNQLLLQLLQEKYGENLPWLVEENQLARARELEAQIAKANHA